jgi:hypothetical protein
MARAAASVRGAQGVPGGARAGGEQEARRVCVRARGKFWFSREGFACFLKREERGSPFARAWRRAPPPKLQHHNEDAVQVCCRCCLGCVALS